MKVSTALCGQIIQLSRTKKREGRKENPWKSFSTGSSFAYFAARHLFKVFSHTSLDRSCSQRAKFNCTDQIRTNRKNYTSLTQSFSNLWFRELKFPLISTVISSLAARAIVTTENGWPQLLLYYIALWLRSGRTMWSNDRCLYTWSLNIFFYSTHLHFSSMVVVWLKL